MSAKASAQLLLMTGQTVPVREVHHSLGLNYFRVEYQGAQKPLGCIAKRLSAEQYEERTREDMRDEVLQRPRATA